ncbi:hypothetical protein H3146_25905 [Streptomyces sp. OF3]|uniref:Uncharacterized protein n=1 Tax=Streptomyces alkaliterrae TaxID=2213162 RepID=A0A7W3ZQG8_9ACTN|nr:hypothetical protein [Streptomyces alkaliterrae]MBB1256753.1 hypothetical protein [Streptomyces alkaliterrae]
MALAREQRGGSGGSRDLEISDEALSALRKRVDAVTRDLRGSAASAAKLRAQVIERAAYSGPGLAAADQLAKQYDRARAELERFTRIFGEQIEALAIAIQMAQKGYNGVEAEQRARFAEIQRNAERYYRAPAPPALSTDKTPVGTGKTVTFDDD